jgi:hypothetical protein
MVCHWGDNRSLEIPRGKRDYKKGDDRAEDNLRIELKVLSLGYGEEI